MKLYLHQVISPGILFGSIHRWHAFVNPLPAAMRLVGAACFLALLVVLSDGQQTRLNVSLDPDALRNVSQLITSKGYPVEEYEVVTSDGFVLQIQRIPHGRDHSLRLGGQPRKVVLLMHGLLSSSADWVVNLPKESLGFILADAGYDVWLGNMRGNTYSRHRRYTRKDKEFWNFSFDEMISYDLPAMIDFVLKTTGEDQLYYVGHSQGTLVLFAMLSQQPEYNPKIRLFSALGPVTTLTYTTSPIRLLAPFSKDFAFIFAMLGEYDFLPSNRFIRFLAHTMCEFRISRLLCENVIFLICGIDSRQLNETRLPVYVSHTPAGTSVKNIVHYAQLIEEKGFIKYDYGSDKNKLTYGQASPPQYNVSTVTTPVALYWSDNDWFADPKDVTTLRGRLPNVVFSYEVPEKEFTHLDFIIGSRANQVVYAKLVEVMKEY